MIDAVRRHWATPNIMNANFRQRPRLEINFSRVPIGLFSISDGRRSCCAIFSFRTIIDDSYAETFVVTFGKFISRGQIAASNKRAVIARAIMLAKLISGLVSASKPAKTAISTPTNPSRLEERWII
jgi:hypothetical protein